ncbi:hypothetical protein CPSG_07301 [Coccidioides posadasii str. Silveira]|uniref:Uncharacterized protein n=1 Tax=Coccidioides posadasii (strain RMSCC 757 / Silveira) TaxID=443226 RepID=E9DBU9_COCPS|nr:hypothetical protein CPSG_07301 [Coccidioides posadasii str. Silveira]
MIPWGAVFLTAMPSVQESSRLSNLAIAWNIHSAYKGLKRCIHVPDICECLSLPSFYGWGDERCSKIDAFCIEADVMLL